MARCCRDTVNWRVGMLKGPLVVGVEIPCRWCDGYARYDGDSGWSYHDRLDDTIRRMEAEIASPEFKALEASAKKKTP